VGIVSVARLAAMVDSWTDTGVTPYPKGQRTRAAARVLFESENRALEPGGPRQQIQALEQTQRCG